MSSSLYTIIFFLSSLIGLFTIYRIMRKRSLRKHSYDTEESNPMVAESKQQHNNVPSLCDRPNLPYQMKDTILTNNEQIFFGLLKEIIDPNRFYILSQVSYSALINRSVIREKYYHDIISQRFVDFVICDLNFHPLCVIELDDPSHLSKAAKSKDENADCIFKYIHLPLIRFSYNSTHDITFLFFAAPFKKLLNQLYDQRPVCENCQKPLDIRQNSSTGKFFWGCPNYRDFSIKCKTTRSLF